MNIFESIQQQIPGLIKPIVEWMSQPEAWIMIALCAALLTAVIAYIRIRIKLNAKKKRGKAKKKSLSQVERRARFSLFRADVDLVDDMEGHDFEQFCANLLKRNDFEEVRVTQASGDQGVDILAEKDGIRYAIQCKNYSSKLGNAPVQEIYAGKTFYHCHVGVVMTNTTFTQSAIDLAEATNVILWDREKLQKFMEGE